jgi:peptidoglycan/xylan/chitin deacetylase (PgdA/CDA1 family)
MRELVLEKWPGDKRVAVILEVNFEGWTDGAAPGQPMPPLRPNTPDPYEQSYGDYGHRIGLGRLLELYDRHGIKGTIMTSGVLAERYPELLKAASDSGHEVAGHGYAQNLMSCYLGESDEISQLDATLNAITKATGVRVKGWRSPRSTSSAQTNALLAERGVLWHGNKDCGDLPILEEYSGRKIIAIQRPTWINDLIICSLHGRPARDFVAAFEDALDYCVTAPEKKAHLISVSVHAHHFGRPYGAWAFERVMQRARASKDVWIARDMDVAQLALDAFTQSDM